MPLPTMVLYDPNHTDPVVLTQRLRVLEAVRANLRRTSGVKSTPYFDAAIEHVENLLGEHLPTGPGGLL